MANTVVPPTRWLMRLRTVHSEHGEVCRATRRASSSRPDRWSLRPPAATAAPFPWVESRSTSRSAPLRPYVSSLRSRIRSLMAYSTASIRECRCSFSRMLRTWFLTVFSEMYNSLGDLAVAHPLATSFSTSISRSVSAGVELLALLDLLRKARELGEELRRHRGRDQAFACDTTCGSLRHLLDARSFSR